MGEGEVVGGAEEIGKGGGVQRERYWGEHITSVNLAT